MRFYLHNDFQSSPPSCLQYVYRWRERYLYNRRGREKKHFTPLMSISFALSLTLLIHIFPSFFLLSFKVTLPFAQGLNFNRIIMRILGDYLHPLRMRRKWLCCSRSGNSRHLIIGWIRKLFGFDQGMHAIRCERVLRLQLIYRYEVIGSHQEWRTFEWWKQSLKLVTRARLFSPILKKVSNHIFHPWKTRINQEKGHGIAVYVNPATYIIANDNWREGDND